MGNGNATRLLILAVVLCAGTCLPTYGQVDTLTYSEMGSDQSSGTVWCMSLTEVFDYGDDFALAEVEAELYDPSQNLVDGGSYADYFYAEVDLQTEVTIPGIYQVTGTHWYWDFWGEAFLGWTYAWASGTPPPPMPQIYYTSPSSSPYGEGSYLQIIGAGFDPNGDGTGLASCSCSQWGVSYTLVSDSEIDVTYATSLSVGYYPVEITATGGSATGPDFQITGDPTPYISSVNPSPWAAGTSFTAYVYGGGFGTAPSLTYTCSSSPCLDYFYPMPVSDGEIDVQVTVNSAAPTEGATLNVTSTGYNDNSFLPGPQGNLANGTAQVGICQTPTLLVAAQYQSGSMTVNAGGTVNITPSPEMPVISTFLAASPGCSLTGTATYQLSTSYPGGGSAFSSGSIPANGVFSVPNSSFYGGSATVNWTYNGAARPAFNFSILGQNPSQSTVQSALGGWPAVNISVQESGLQEFVLSPNGPGGNTPGFPMKDYANGFGLMALTSPAPSEDQKWNWQSNVDAGLALLQTKMNDALTFLQGQIVQWNSWNTRNPNQQAAAAPDYWATSCCIFSLGNTGTMTYDQADGLKRYAGLGIGNPSAFLWLSNPSGGNPPAWQITPSNGVAADIVYQFATCSSVGSSCQHSGTGCIRGSSGCPIQ